MAAELPLVFTRSVAAECGFSTGQIRRRILGGAWTRLNRGVYAETRRLSGATGETHGRHLLAELAALSSAVAAAGQPVWVAGPSARWLLNLPEARRPGDVEGSLLPPLAWAVTRRTRERIASRAL